MQVSRQRHLQFPNEGDKSLFWVHGTRLRRFTNVDLSSKNLGTKTLGFWQIRHAAMEYISTNSRLFVLPEIYLWCTLLIPIGNKIREHQPYKYAQQFSYFRYMWGYHKWGPCTNSDQDGLWAQKVRFMTPRTGAVKKLIGGWHNEERKIGRICLQTDFERYSLQESERECTTKRPPI